MKKYYLKLIDLSGVIMGDYSSAHWEYDGRRELKSANLSDATQEGLEVFAERREFWLPLIDHRFTKAHKEKLINSFPKEIIIIEEIIHKIPV